MSGFPNTEQIEHLRKVLQCRQVLLDEGKGLTDTIDQAKLRLAEINRELHEGAESSLRLVAQMDCRSSGNTGYERRILLLLTELANPPKGRP